MNVLLTSAGRRAYMVKYFKEALQGNGSVHAGNSDRISVAFKYADKTVVTPLIYDAGYIPFLLEYCKRNRIDLLISLFDMDLLMLAKHKKEFEEAGTKVIVSDPAIIEICNDKWKTFEFLASNGFHTPRSFLRLDNVLDAIREGELQYPIVVKPRFGCGSLSVETAYDEEDLRCLTKRADYGISHSYLKFESAVTDEKVIFQEKLKGEEYGAEVHGDRGGYVVSPPYRIFNTVSGQLNDPLGATTLKYGPILNEDLHIEELRGELRRMADIMGFSGIMEIDLVLVRGEWYILEINNRWSGLTTLITASQDRLPYDVYVSEAGSDPALLDDVKNLKYALQFKMKNASSDDLERISKESGMKSVIQYDVRLPGKEPFSFNDAVIGGYDSMEELLSGFEALQKKYPEMISGELTEALKEKEGGR